VGWLVTDNLEDLHGPTRGLVTLPSRLTGDQEVVFDLDDPDQGGRMYEIVLQHAAVDEDLTEFLDAELLLQWWPRLTLPVLLRELWELVQPFLKADLFPSFGNLRPYQTPSSFDDLRGPTTGTVTVGSHINTAPHPVYDLDDPASLPGLYRAVVRDGIPADHATFLDRATLVRLWPALILPSRCRQVWETRFPVLARSSRAAGVSREAVS
jgi:hypothetical protein